MIKLQIIGHLGGDCTQNEVSGKTVLNFNVAHSEKYKDSQGNLVEKTTWVKCAYWTDRTAIAPYLVKGQLIYAEGSPDVDAYLNKENQNAASLKLKVFNIQLLGSKSDNNNQNGGNNQNSGNQAQPSSNVNAASPTQVEEPADDLPF